MRLLDVLRLRQRPITDTVGFRDFMAEQAVFTAQKFAYGYVRKRAGRSAEALVTEAPFIAAMDVCRYEGSAVLLGDLLVLAEHHLRPHAPPADPHLHAALCAIHRGALKALGLPAHRRNWADVLNAFPTRLKEAQAAPPQPLTVVTRPGWQALYDRLPVPEAMRRNDHAILDASFRLWVTTFHDTLVGRVDAAAVAGALLRATADPPLARVG